MATKNEKARAVAKLVEVSGVVSVLYFGQHTRPESSQWVKEQIHIAMLELREAFLEAFLAVKDATRS